MSLRPDGKEKLQAAEPAHPGEIIQYDALYHNRGAKPLRDLALTLPIPKDMEYVPDSARPAPTKASLDGKIFEEIPLKRRVVLPSGKVEERKVSATEYRALRWEISNMAAEEKMTVVARARVVPLILLKQPR